MDLKGDGKEREELPLRPYQGQHPRESRQENRSIDIRLAIVVVFHPIIASPIIFDHLIPRLLEMFISVKKLLSLFVIMFAIGASVAVLAQGPWKNTIAGVVHNDSLYSVETDGALYVTDLGTGKWRQIGKPEFGNTRFMFAGGRNLLTIEKDGSLYRVNPSDGSWVQIGEAGAWKNTLAGAFVGGRLYTAEPSGHLYATDPATGAYVSVGKPEFGRTQRMFSSDNGLFTIESDGSLYTINPSDGSWRQLGKSGEWKNTIARTTLGGMIYTIETSGALYETNPATGTWRQIGKAEFGKTRLLMAARGSLYSLENGYLYRINPSSGAWAEVGQ